MRGEIAKCAYDALQRDYELVADPVEFQKTLYNMDKRHSALNSVISSPNYEIEQAFVLCEDNVSEDGKVLYLPTYMVMFV